MIPMSPSAQEMVTSPPSGTAVVASPAPTTAGIPSSRAMMAAWQVRPPRLVTMALAIFMTGSQSGSVMSVTSTSPVWSSFMWLEERITRARPAAILWPTLFPRASTGPRSFRV